MDWKYKLKRAFFNRYAMTAVLFLAIMLWGSVTVLLGVLDQKTACEGYDLPKPLVKADPAIPGRSLASDIPPADLTAERATVTAWPDQLSAKTAKAELAVTKALEKEHSLIQVFGAFEGIVERTVVEDAAEPLYSVVKLPGGSLTFVGQGEPEAQAQTAELKRLQMALDERDISLLYLQAPSKLEPGEDVLPYGLEDPSNACADRLLAALEEAEIDHLDLRQTLKEAGGDWDDWFYQTDHHWNQEAAFVAFQALAERLEGYQRTVEVGRGTKRQSIQIDPRYTDPDSYDKETLSAFFLGSQGKRVGTLYGGADDFVLWTPNFPTLLHYAGVTGGDRYGDATETLLFPQRVEEKDFFDGNPYTYYSGGDYPFAKITNYYNPDGPRVMLIRDSFACAITPYLALSCSELTTVDPRYFPGDLLAQIDRVKPDVVVLLYSSGFVREEEPYRLLAQPAGPSKADVLRWKDDWYESEK